MQVHRAWLVGAFWVELQKVTFLKHTLEQRQTTREEVPQVGVQLYLHLVSPFRGLSAHPVLREMCLIRQYLCLKQPPLSHQPSRQYRHLLHRWP
jgi:hypothetical protein